MNPRELLDKKWPLLGLINGATFVTLCTLIGYNIANYIAIENGDGDDNGRNRWRNEDGEWDPDYRMREEDWTALKIVLCLLVLIIGCVCLIIPARKVWHPTTGSVTKVPVGVLSALQFMFGQMLFISYWFLSDFQVQEEEENNENQDENDDAYQMTEEELLAYYQRITRNVLIVMALIHLVTSAYLFDWGRKLSSSSPASESLTTEKTGHIGLFRDVWKFFSYLSLGILSLQTLRTVYWFFGPGGDRMREEGLIYNHFLVTLSALMLTAITCFVGNRVLVKKTWTDPLVVGALGGCYMGLGLTFFMLFLIYMAEEMPISVSLSVCAFFLFTLDTFVGGLILKYSDAILADISEDSDNVGSDYQTMETPTAPEEQLSDSEYVKEFDEEGGDVQMQEKIV